uniref:Protein zer-1 homolog n=1 Tax=Strigamia maritima TaxID=126957 RepID=T1IJT0_STRMM
MSMWDGNTPDSLVDISTRFCVQNLETFCNFEPTTKRYYLRITLPNEICERMLTSQKQDSRTIDDDFLRIFKDPRTTRLRRVNLSKSTVTDEGLDVVLRHNLIELDISDCDKITEESLTLINEFGSDLLSLNVGTSVHIFPDNATSNAIVLLAQMQAEPHLSSTNNTSGCILKTPNLRKLIFREMSVPMQDGYFPILLKPLKHLQSLDLSGCFNLGSLSFLTHMTQLASLTLYNVPRVQNMINAICQMKTLRHLDISQHIEKHGVYRNPNQLLTQIVDSLPRLVSLDISGTNLAGTGVAEHDHTDIDERTTTKWAALRPTTAAVTDISGLRNRVNSPLDFLGLYGTSHNACHRHHIPAKKITGDANERQTLTAAHAYLDRADILQKVLNDLFKIVRFETCYNAKAALEVILNAMEKHLTDKHIQISGSASLFYILKGEEKKHFNIKINHKLIKVVLDAMCEHTLDTTMMRNGCLTLCQFKIPQDVLFDYKRLVRILLHVVSEDDQEDFVQRIGIYLLNSLACQVDGTQKQLVGDLGAINIMLRLIECRLQRQLCDDVMEIAWSTMWNVTDETPVNCLRFLEGRGMTFFLECLHMFTNKAELLRNMMGLLGNVAEVQELRPRLMTEEFIKVFSELLDSTSDGIEVSYNAAGVLSHIASDGKESWNITSPKREDVLQRMVDAIERWDIKTKRNINYRSFEPILRLLYVEHTAEAQHWAVWALANLTCVYPEKYCDLIKEEKGIEILNELINRGTVQEKVKELAALVISHCESFKEGNGIVAMDE